MPSTDILIIGHEHWRSAEQIVIAAQPHYRWVLARSLAEAVLYLRAGGLPRLLVIDLKIGAAAVDAFLAELHADPTWHWLPVLLLGTGEEAMHAAAQPGAVHFLARWVEAETLRAVLADCLVPTA
ncbi:MAG: hypothetical protein HC915_18140 [Anaerolineae bacterium]|nr:hypothetical protein [Anaerolineae bacterium]